MATPLKFTPAHIREIRKQADRSLLYFSRGLWGNKDIDPDVHGEMCRILQYGDWKRLLICAARGLLKSSIVHSWIVWQGLQNTDWSAMLIEQREANARAHHEKIQNRFRWGQYAGLLQAVYEDRLPDGFEGWTTGAQGRTILVRENPDADPFLTHAGMDSKLESAHKDAVIVDDPEGADADKSDAPNAEAKKLIEERATPLLKSPSDGRIVAVMTPHGADPTAWYLRDLAEKQRAAQPGNSMNWVVHWQPITDTGEEDGRLIWPARHSKEWWESERFKATLSARVRRMIDMQYLLKRATAGAESLDYQKVLDGCYERSGRVLRYMTIRYEEPKPENQFQYVQRVEAAHGDLSFMNRYLHVDPLHKDPAERRTQEKRPSRWAIMATAVAWDFHVFVVEEWVEDAPFDVAMDQLFKMYRYWQPRAVTFDPVGAQSWITHQVRQLEKSRYNRGLMSLPTPWSKMPTRLPALSHRLVEAHKGPREKESWIVENLEMPINTGHLHFAASLEKTLEEIRHLGQDATHPVDGLDALAQGPGVWEAPVSPEKKRKIAWKRHLEELLQPVDPLTGYRRPWSEDRLAS